MVNEDIQIIGYNGKPIKTTLIKNQMGNQMLAVIFPGYSYSVQGPILYFSRKLLENMGYDVLTVDYRYNEDREFVSAEDDIQDKWFNYDICSIIDMLKTYNQYKGYVFLGKSMGTTVLLNIAREGYFKPAKYVWITPDCSFEEVINYINCSSSLSLILGGSKDSFFRQDLIREVKNNVMIKVFSNAGHSLEKQNDVLASIDNVKEAIKEIQTFLISQ